MMRILPFLRKEWDEDRVSTLLPPGIGGSTADPSRNTLTDS
jgi:hypothetical protein